MGTPKNLVIVNAVGGWDTTYTIDPKPAGGIPILDAATRPFGRAEQLVDIGA